jgi:hypothetical protein
MADEPVSYASPDAPTSTIFPSTWLGANGRLAALLPSIRSALAGIGAAAGNPSAQEQLNVENSQQMQQALLRSQLTGQSLQQRMQANELANYQSPADKQSQELDTAAKLAQIHNTLTDAPPMGVPQSDGTIKYFQPKFDKASNQWQLAPAMVTENKVISSPSQTQIPCRNDVTVTEPTQVPLSGVNPAVFTDQLERQRDKEKSDLEFNRQKALLTDPLIQSGKVAIANAEGAARVNRESANVRGSNAALASVPPHLVAPATAAATKAGEGYADAVAAAADMATFISEAKGGNKLAYSYAPTEGVLSLNTSRGVKRVNMPEIHSYGAAGSAYDRVMGFLGRQASGASIPDDILNDMASLHGALAQNASRKYANTLQVVNQTYGSKFEPVEFAGGGGGGGSVQVTDPSGGVHTFPDQASADKFRQLAGIR